MSAIGNIVYKYCPSSQAGARASSDIQTQVCTSIAQCLERPKSTRRVGMPLTLEQLVVPAGSQVLLNIDWQTFEALLDATLETLRTPRFSYSQGWLELMSPLAVHEFDKKIIGNFVEIILELTLSGLTSFKLREKSKLCR